MSDQPPPPPPPPYHPPAKKRFRDSPVYVVSTIMAALLVLLIAAIAIGHDFTPQQPGAFSTEERRIFTEDRRNSTDSLSRSEMEEILLDVIHGNAWNDPIISNMTDSEILEMARMGCDVVRAVKPNTLDELSTAIYTYMDDLEAAMAASKLLGVAIPVYCSEYKFLFD